MVRRLGPRLPRVPWAHLDPAFAKYQLLVLLREWFLHPNGALPAYEWNFDDVNPPVHVHGSAARVPDRRRPRPRFLERVFQKLLVNFTWWLNREDADGNNVFSGGFLGLDNISPIDRSNLPDGRARSSRRTARRGWRTTRSRCSSSRSSSREENDVYEDMVVKFLEQFVLIARALEGQDLYDAEDGFFYDRLVCPTGERVAGQGADDRRACSPSCPPAALPAGPTQRAEQLGKRFARLRADWTEMGGSTVGRVRELGDERHACSSR